MHWFDEVVVVALDFYEVGMKPTPTYLRTHLRRLLQIKLAQFRLHNKYLTKIC